jgi:AcrR family transcriptional regulator
VANQELGVGPGWRQERNHENVKIVMTDVASTEKRSSGRRTGRIGRPRRELAGEVDERILNAARRAFIKRGLAGASIDEIANIARAGKPTIYARFPNKVALFTAVVMRNVATVTGRFEGHVPAGATIEERLTNLGATMLEWALAGDTIDLMRVAISEAQRFPDLASSVHGMARRCGEDSVGRLLSDAAQSDGLGTLPAFAPDRLATTTQFFMDLVFKPMIMRALFGEKLKSLRAEIGPHVAHGVAFFLAACRHGGVN